MAGRTGRAVAEPQPARRSSRRDRRRSCAGLALIGAAAVVLTGSAAALFTGGDEADLHCEPDDHDGSRGQPTTEPSERDHVDHEAALPIDDAGVGGGIPSSRTGRTPRRRRHHRHHRPAVDDADHVAHHVTDD